MEAFDDFKPIASLVLPVVSGLTYVTRYLSAVLLIFVAAGCRLPPGLRGDWAIPFGTPSTSPIARTLVIVADNQFNHLYGDAVWLRSGMPDRVVSVAIRPVQLDVFAPDLLRWILEARSGAGPVVHLGDALNISCSSELEAFLEVMRGATMGWVMAPGNHDAYYFGNGSFSDTDWKRACSTPDGAGRPVTKDLFVEAYLRALAGQRGRAGGSGSAPLFDFELPSKLEGSHVWQSADPAAFVTAVAWRIDRNHPSRSYVVQRLSLVRPGGSAGWSNATAVLLDTSTYRFGPQLVPIPPWRNAGLTGELGDEQIGIVESWLGASATRDVTLVLGHHPFDDLSSGARRAIEQWRREFGIALYVSAHTHQANYFVHRGSDDRNWLELNVGSTTDWPPQATTLRLAELRDDPRRTALQVQRWSLPKVWFETQEEGSPECPEEWEVRPEAPDAYVSYRELTSLDAAEMERRLLVTLLRTYARMIGFVPTALDNTTWPPNTLSDAEAQARIEQAAGRGSPAEMRTLLGQLVSFESERRVTSEKVRWDYRRCQATWASMYEARGIRAPGFDDPFFILPAR